MKRRVLFVTFMFLGLCVPAFARQNWVDQFLSRYKPSSTPSASVPLTQDRLPALIQSGQIPLSVLDLINLTLENNLDITVNRFSPIASDYAIRTNYRPFEPTLRLGFNFSNDRSVSRTQLTGVNAVGQSTDSSLRFFPSALPMLIMARNVANIAVGLRISVICGVLVAIAAGIDFCRREVS